MRLFSVMPCAVSLCLSLPVCAQEDEPLPTPAGEADLTWLEQHLVGARLRPEHIELLDEATTLALPPAAPGTRWARIDGVFVQLDPFSYQVVELIAGDTNASAPAPDIPPG